MSGRIQQKQFYRNAVVNSKGTCRIAVLGVSWATMEPSMDHLGRLFALATAVIWAFAVVLFKKSGETVHPVALNVFKNLLAFILIAPTIWISGGEVFRDNPARDYILIFISGALGIGIADTLFFMSLNRVGAGLSAILSCLYSPFMIGMSMIFLHEKMTFLQIFGVFLIISAILTAASRKGSGDIPRGVLLQGVLLAALANMVMAYGIIIIKPILDSAPLLWVTEMRLVGGMMVLAVVLAVIPGRIRIMKTLLTGNGWLYSLAGSFFGTYVAYTLWLAGMKYTTVSVAAALNQTSNIFLFIFAALILKEAINYRKTIGIILGVGGALIIVLT